jgi:hypothetical protein
MHSYPAKKNEYRENLFFEIMFKWIKKSETKLEKKKLDKI